MKPSAFGHYVYYYSGTLLNISCALPEKKRLILSNRATGKSSRRIGAVSAMIYLRSIQVDRRSRPTVSLVKLFPSAYVVGQKPAGAFV